MKANRGHPTTTARLESVTITWCGKNGKKRMMEVDLSQAKGILWAYDPDVPVGDLPPTQVKKVIPKRGPIKDISDCTPPAIVEAHSEGPSCCWWDGAQWVCPDEPQ